MLTVFRFDPSPYRLREWACEVLGVRDLAQHHHHLMRNDDGRFVLKHRPRVYWASRRLLAAFGPEMRVRMADFVREEVAPRVPFRPWTELGPNFRLHEHGAEATSILHRDRHYLKERGSLKIWLPFTRVSGGGTLFVESEEGRGDLTPMRLDYGEALLFDSLNLLHGCRFNDSGSSRVSMDFIIRPDPAAGRPAS